LLSIFNVWSLSLLLEVDDKEPGPTKVLRGVLMQKRIVDPGLTALGTHVPLVKRRFLLL
jgi:hypothetical protein